MKQFIKEKLAGRTQRWLCLQIGMKEVDFTNSIYGYRKFTETEWDKVVAALELTPEDLENPAVTNYVFSKKVATL